MIRTRLMFFALLVLMTAGVRAQDDIATARALHDEGRYAAAAAIFERLHLADMTDYQACLGFGQSLFMQHEGSRSLALFEKAARLAPESAEPLFWMGQVLERNGMAEKEKGGIFFRPTLADAASAYQRALTKDPRNIDAHAALVRVLFLLQRMDEAIAAVDAWLKIEPANVTALTYRLGLYYRAERYEDFLQACEAAKDLMTLDLGRMLDANARLGRIAETEKLFMQMFDEGYSGRLEPYNYMVAAWSEGERRADLVRLLQKLMAERPEETYGWFYLGFSLALVERYDESRAAFERSLEALPNDVATLGHLANIARLQNRLDDARALATTLIGLAPDAPKARFEVSATVLALVESKRFSDALALHSRLYDLDPDDSDFAHDQAILLKETGRLEEAAAILRTLVEEAPVETSRLASFMNDYGLCLNGLGRRDEAIAAFKRAAATWERQADAQENLGVLYFELGRRDEARAAFLAAIAARAAAEITDEKANWRARYYLRAMERQS